MMEGMKYGESREENETTGIYTYKLYHLILTFHFSQEEITHVEYVNFHCLEFLLLKRRDI